MAKAAFNSVQEETSQGHSTRSPLYTRIERLLGDQSFVIAFFTSFTHPVTIDDMDADMIEEVLRSSSIEGKKLYLLINSPGGDGLAAERIVNICRTYGGGSFSAIVPRRAKSAATMVCLGAEKIILSSTAELGPIDPQILVRNEQGEATAIHAAHEIIESYEGLLKMANQTKGRVEPYLQQLARFDARDIRRIRSAQDLSSSIAVRCLKSGMMSGKSDKVIERCIRPFLDPSYTKSHSRPIYYQEAAGCGLNVELSQVKSDLWQAVSDLYVRLNHFCNVRASKAIETEKNLYHAALN